MSGFKKATRLQARLRLALQGASGSGKTRSALEIARHFGTVAVIDTEHGSASKYVGVSGLEFDVCEVTEDYDPDKLVELLSEAGKSYDCLVIDSMTHWWNGAGGFLELVDAEVKKQKARGGKGDSFAAWKDIDPKYKRLVHAILSCPAHVIVTMRAKQSYEKEQDDRGKTTIKKMGLAPEMRDGFAYEMDIEGMLDMEHNLVIGKTRCDAIDGKYFHKPGKELAELLKTWLSVGAPAPAPKEPVDWDVVASSALASIAAANDQDALAIVVADLPKLLPKGEAPSGVRTLVSNALSARKQELAS